MDPLEHTHPLPLTPTTLLLAAALLTTTLLLTPPSRAKLTRLLRWAQRKHYQYEVTFSLYMMTPTEKFVLNSLVFLALSLLLIAAILYLPSHVVTMSRRAFYYYSGSSAGGPAGGVHAAARKAAGGTARKVAVESARAVSEAVGA